MPLYPSLSQHFCSLSWNKLFPRKILKWRKTPAPACLLPVCIHLMIFNSLTAEAKNFLHHTHLLLRSFLRYHISTEDWVHTVWRDVPVQAMKVLLHRLEVMSLNSYNPCKTLVWKYTGVTTTLGVTGPHWTASKAQKLVGSVRDYVSKIRWKAYKKNLSNIDLRPPHTRLACTHITHVTHTHKHM